MTPTLRRLAATVRALGTSARRGLVQPRSGGLDALHVFVLWSFAVAQPVFDLLGGRGAYLADLALSRASVLAIVALIALAVPAVLVLGLRLGALLGRRTYEALLTLMMFLLWCLIWVPIVKRLLIFGAGSTLALSLVGAAASTVLYFSFRRVRDVVTFAAPGIALFPVVLVFGSSAAGFFFAPAAISGGSGESVPVIVIVFDEFCGLSLQTPERDLDVRRFPNFGRLASISTWFPEATTVHQETWRAVPAILSGRYPHTAGPPLPADLPQNLFSVLAATGEHELAAFEPVSNLAPRSEESGGHRYVDQRRRASELLDSLARAFLFHITPVSLQTGLPKLSRLWFGLREDDFIDPQALRGVFRYPWGKSRDGQFEHFLRTIDGGPRPALHFIHLLAPHVPWCYLPSGRAYIDDAGNWELLNFNTHNALADYWGHDEWIVVQSEQRYLLQLQYVDRLIGRLLDRLQEAGWLERSLLVVTADHGVSFRPNQSRRGASDANRADILSVPLFIKRPGQRQGSVNERLIETVDILPTIADLLDIRLSLPTDGRSAFDDSRPARTTRQFVLEYEPIAAPADLLRQSDAPQLVRSRFGDSRQADSLYRIGPHPELIGRPVEELVTIPEAARGSAGNPPAWTESQSPADFPITLELLRAGDTLSLDGSALVPCYFDGQVRRPAPNESPTVLAVAVNGVVCAVTRTYTLPGVQSRWSALVPEGSFHEGRNDVRFYAVAVNAGEWRLTECATQFAEP